MRLSTVLPGRVINGDPDPPVTGLAYDSRRVEPGFVFFCIRGLKQDGHDFLGEACRRGAIAAVMEKPVTGSPVPVFRVENSRRALAEASAAFYGDPGRRLHLVGISGTNGKTTVSYWLDSIYSCAGTRSGVIGTIGYRCARWTLPSSMTTPESLELQGLLCRMLKAGTTHVVMEVSSHALVMERVSGLSFAAAVLTNVTHDHLDFHGDIGRYRAVKAGFLKGLGRDRLAVTNADDPFCRSLHPGDGVRLITFGFRADATVRALSYAPAPDGGRAVIDLEGRPLPVRLRLPGRFNLANALAAAAVAFGEGLDPAAIKEGLESLTAVPGRCETVETGAGFRVIVDFAHNPDALAKLLSLPPPSPAGRRILVFGCEGGKDRLKRPLMGAVAARGADRVILTCDNLHDEEPQQIFREVMGGLKDGPARHEVVADRCQAIRRALELARPGDLVLVAGKGDERHMIVRGEYLPFDDREVVGGLLGGDALPAPPETAIGWRPVVGG